MSDRNKREYYCAKYSKKCDAFVTKNEIEKVKQRKLSVNELYELKLERISEESLGFDEEEKKTAYVFYLMNRGYTYEEKIIKSDATDVEFAYISENVDNLSGFNTKIDWERVYPYGNVLRGILGTVSTTV